MKQIGYSIIIYFPAIFIFKFLGNMGSDAWVNYYWLVSSLIFSYIFYNIAKLCDNKIIRSLYNKRDYNLYKGVIYSCSIYWGVMTALRVYLSFNIEKYDIISSARKLTVGGISIVICSIYLIYLTAKRNDNKNER